MLTTDGPALHRVGALFHSPVFRGAIGALLVGLLCSAVARATGCGDGLEPDAQRPVAEVRDAGPPAIVDQTVTAIGWSLAGTPPDETFIAFYPEPTGGIGVVACCEADHSCTRIGHLVP